MTVLEKIKRCVSLVWDFQEFYGDEDIEDFCSNELDTYSQYNEILDYFKRITELEQENKVLAQNLEDTEIINKALEKEVTELKGEADSVLDNWCKGDDPCPHLKKRDDQLTNAKELLKKLLVHSKRYIWIGDDNNKPIMQKEIAEAEQFLKDQEEEAFYLILL